MLIEGYFLTGLTSGGRASVLLDFAAGSPSQAGLPTRQEGAVRPPTGPKPNCGERLLRQALTGSSRLPAGRSPGSRAGHTDIKTASTPRPEGLHHTRTL